MRILSLYVQNVNSIRGEWNIDFRHADYAANGLFAITGPTGAGKSTLLDAICLALYGRTPRINAISPSGNEVMSRGSFECECRLVFEAGGREYLAGWRQNRARKKSDGKLQKCDVRLLRLDPESGQWDTLASSLTAMGALVPEITGLTYEQFTRSVLLAQGSFSVFLKSKPDERAVTLEQITGTDIYSEISKRVQQRHAAESNGLNDLKAKLAYRTPLSETARADLSNRLTRLERETADSNKQLATTNEALAWRRSVDRLIQTVERTTAQTERLKEQWLGTIDQRQRLDKAEHAAALVPTHEKLLLIEQQQTLTRSDLSSSETKLSQLTQQSTRLEEASQNAVETELKTRTARETLNHLLIQVREIDTQLFEAERQRRDRSEQLALLTARGTAQKNALTTKQENLAALLAKQDRLTQWVAQHVECRTCDEREDELAADYRAIEQHREQCRETNRALNSEQDLAELARQRLHAHSPRVRSLEEKIRNKQEAIASQETTRRSLLNGQSLEYWKNEVESLTERITLLTCQRSELREYFDAQKAVHDHVEQCHRTDERLLHLQERLQATRQSLAQYETHRNDLLRLCAVERLAKERETLIAEVPCPLCGSLHHPYAMTPPEADPDMKRRLSDQEALCMATLEQVRTLEHEVLQQNGRKQLLEQTRVEAQERLALLTTRAQSMFATTDAAIPADAIEQLDAALLQAQTDLSRLKERLANLDKLSQCLLNEQRAIDVVRVELDAARAQTLRLSSLVEQHKAKIELLKQTVDKLERHTKEQLARWSERVASLHVNALDATGDPKALLDQIHSLAQTYRDRNQELQALLEKRRDLEMEIRIDADALASLEKQTQESADYLAETESKATALQSRRHALFGQRSCEQEELDARRAHEAARNQSLHARNALETHRQALSGLRAKIAQLHHEADRLCQSEGALREQWRTELTQHGFESTEGWAAARMNEQDVRRQREDVDSLRSTLEAAEKQLRESQNELETQRTLNLSDRSSQELTRALQTIQAEIQEKSSQIGEIKAQLRSDDDILKEQAAIRVQVQTQEVVTERWSQLNQLIGSADGKKYRTFVQGLTFDTLIAFANDALFSLSRRYVLTRNGVDNLDLDVIDRDMAGIKRSCDNLSGGETFIISLALALGLSRMASRNVRIDSLFLDEGFGSLDEESLEKALTALSNLNQDRKLIGIISHVGRIQDRIPVRIEVQPTHSGVSSLSGPGVTKGW